MIRKIRDPAEGEFLEKVNRYLDHCERAQKNRDDMNKNKGIIPKIREKLYGKPERESQFSGLCGECFDIISSLVTLTEVYEPLNEYRNDIQQIQRHCINEKCKDALALMNKVKEKIPK